MSKSGERVSHQKGGFRAGQIPFLPEPVKSRNQLGQDLQPVGDYAGIEPYYRVCVDVDDVQQQDLNELDVFNSSDWWWTHQKIRFLNGKAFLL